jgi:predicted regulator of Ras-like GTPase activity (Roadblock/LC7/MglB family)
MELSPEMRAGAILESGRLLAASNDEDGWAEATAELLAAADAGGRPAEQVHVATEAGEVFALRAGKLTAVAVTERFVLASLMAFDMRAALRDLDAEPATAKGS